MGMYIKNTLILCDIFSFEVHTYDVILICACRCLAVFGISLDLVKEKKHFMDEWIMWKLFIEENYEIIAYLNF